MTADEELAATTAATLKADIAATGGVNTLRCKKWRMTHLYRVRPPGGKGVVLFAPTLEQRRFYAKQRECRRVVWLKCRGVGGSAAVAVDLCDDIFFNQGTNAIVVANTDERAGELFGDIYQTIYQNPVVPGIFPSLLKGTEDSQYSLKFGPGWAVQIALKFVGGTYQYVHNTELGQLSFENPSRAKEFRIQGLPTLRDLNCKIVVEATARGTVGTFKEMWDMAVATDAEINAGTRQRDPLDWGSVFARWYRVPWYVRTSPYPISKADAEYFAGKEKLLGITFSDQQKWWYCWQLHDQMAPGGIASPEDMHANFPTDPEEAFAASTEGLVFGRELSEALADGRFGDFRWDKRFPVHTAWDYGVDEKCAIVHFQQIGNRYHCIDYDEGAVEGADVNVAIVKNKPWARSYGVHFGPHDVATRDRWFGKTILQVAKEQGLRFEPVERCNSVQEKHDCMRIAFNRFCFDRTGCSVLWDRLNSYRKKWNKALQDWSGVVKDQSCHGADAVILIAQQFEMISERTRPTKLAGKVGHGKCVFG